MSQPAHDAYDRRFTRGFKDNFEEHFAFNS